MGPEPLPAALERFVVPAQELMRSFLQAAGHPAAQHFAEGGMVGSDTGNELSPSGLGQIQIGGNESGTDGDAEMLLRQMSEGLPPAPGVFVQYLEGSPESDNEVAADLAAVYAQQPEAVDQLYFIAKRLAQDEPENLPPRLLALLGSGKNAPIGKQPPVTSKVGPMVSRRTEQSKPYAKGGGGVPLPPGI